MSWVNSWNDRASGSASDAVKRGDGLSIDLQQHLLLTGGARGENRDLQNTGILLARFLRQDDTGLDHADGAFQDPVGFAVLIARRAGQVCGRGDVSPGQSRQQGNESTSFDTVPRSAPVEQNVCVVGETLAPSPQLLPVLQERRLVDPLIPQSQLAGFSMADHVQRSDIRNRIQGSRDLPQAGTIWIEQDDVCIARDAGENLIDSVDAMVNHDNIMRLRFDLISSGFADDGLRHGRPHIGGKHQPGLESVRGPCGFRTSWFRSSSFRNGTGASVHDRSQLGSNPRMVSGAGTVHRVFGGEPTPLMEAVPLRLNRRFEAVWGHRRLRLWLLDFTWPTFVWGKASEQMQATRTVVSHGDWRQRECNPKNRRGSDGPPIAAAMGRLTDTLASSDSSSIERDSERTATPLRPRNR